MNNNFLLIIQYVDSFDNIILVLQYHYRFIKKFQTSDINKIR